MKMKNFTLIKRKTKVTGQHIVHCHLETTPIEFLALHSWKHDFPRNLEIAWTTRSTRLEAQIAAGIAQAVESTVQAVESTAQAVESTVQAFEGAVVVDIAQVAADTAADIAQVGRTAVQAVASIAQAVVGTEAVEIAENSDLAWLKYQFQNKLEGMGTGYLEVE